MSPELVGILGSVLLLILFALRMQVGLSMLIVGFLGFTYLSNTSASLPLLGMVPYATASAYSLSVIPLFILMGMFLSYGGLGKDIFEAANAWVRHREGRHGDGDDRGHRRLVGHLRLCHRYRSHDRSHRAAGNEKTRL